MFPDGTEDEHLIINRECSEDDMVCLASDEDLACIIWISAASAIKVDLSIIIETCKYCCNAKHHLHITGSNMISLCLYSSTAIFLLEV
jgi:hypothetical protein